VRATHGRAINGFSRVGLRDNSIAKGPVKDCREYRLLVCLQATAAEEVSEALGDTLIGPLFNPAPLAVRVDL
jgi:hypothetical protein